MHDHAFPTPIVERPARGHADGLLVLHHGRGSHEHDLLGLADLVDPEQRLHVASVRAPLQLPGMPGYHWYVVPRVGYPDPDTFHAARALLARVHDGLWESTGIDPSRTILGGFSMGSVMSHAMACGGDRPVPAGVLACAGFLPVVEGWELSLPAAGHGLHTFISHGTADPVMDVGFAHAAARELSAAGVQVELHEFAGGHEVRPDQVLLARQWVEQLLAR